MKVKIKTFYILEITSRKVDLSGITFTFMILAFKNIVLRGLI